MLIETSFYNRGHSWWDESRGRGLVCSDSGLGKELHLGLPGIVKGRLQLGGWSRVRKDAFLLCCQAGDVLRTPSLSFPCKIRDGWKNLPRFSQFTLIFPTGVGSYRCGGFEPPDREPSWGRRLLQYFCALLSQRRCCKKSQSCLDLLFLESCLCTRCFPCSGVSNKR